MNQQEDQKATLPSMDGVEISCEWLATDTVGLFTLSPETLATAKEVLMAGWKQRAAERGLPEPSDLAGACKFASLFAKIAFGGTIEGAYEHQYNVIHGKMFDLSEQAGHDGIEHDYTFFGNSEHLESLESCLPRVRGWIENLVDLLQAKMRVIHPTVLLFVTTMKQATLVTIADSPGLDTCSLNEPNGESEHVIFSATWKTDQDVEFGVAVTEDDMASGRVENNAFFFPDNWGGDGSDIKIVPFAPLPIAAPL